MTALLIRNEVSFLARTLAFRVLSVVCAAWVGLLTFSRLFIAPPDAPALDTFPLHAILLGTLTLVVPWLVARQLSDERGAALVEVSAQAAVPPEQAVMAKVAASVTSIVQLYVVTLPIGVMAWAAGRGDTAYIVMSLVSLLCLNVACVMLTYHACLLSERRVSSWALATIDSVAATVAYLALRARAGDAIAAITMTGLAIVLLAWLRVRARRHLLYLATA